MKNLLFRGLCALGLTVALRAPAAAQVTQDNTGFGTSSGEFLLLGAGARGAALGGAVAALTTDVTALYYNPGNLAEMQRPGVMISTYTYVANTRYSWGGLAFPMSGGTRAVGVSVGSFGFSDQPVYTLDQPEGTGETYSVAETFLQGTYSQNFSDRFSAGFSAKFISDALGRTKANGVALDFGTNFHASIGQRPIRGAFLIQNLGSNLKHQGAAIEATALRRPPQGVVDFPQQAQPTLFKTSGWSLPVLFRVAVSFDLVTQAQHRVTLLSEFTQPNNNKAGAGAGLEYAMSDLGNSGFSLAARGSYTIQPANQLDPGGAAGFATNLGVGSFTKDGLALGGGIGYTRKSLNLGFDYAYRDLGPLGGTHYMSVALGW